MSNTTIEKLEDLDFVIQDYIYLSGKKDVEVDKEIYNNFWQIMFSPDLIKDVTLFDLQDFVYKLFQKRTEQIKELGIESHVTFYMWFDDMIGQLCFNLLSGEAANLPFKCTLNVVDSPDFILKNFLEEEKKAVERGGHLLFEDMVILEPGDEGWDDEMWYKNSDPKDYTLDVYVITIP